MSMYCAYGIHCLEDCASNLFDAIPPKYSELAKNDKMQLETTRWLDVIHPESETSRASIIVRDTEMIVVSHLIIDPAHLRKIEIECEEEIKEITRMHSAVVASLKKEDIDPHCIYLGWCVVCV